MHSQIEDIKLTSELNISEIRSTLGDIIKDLEEKRKLDAISILNATYDLQSLQETMDTQIRSERKKTKALDTEVRNLNLKLAV